MESHLIDSLVRIIQTVGFPIAVCLWFMLRLEKRLDKQTEVMQDIAAALKSASLTPGAGGTD